MKLNVHAILYLLCASVITTECSNAAEANRDVVYNKAGEEVNIASFAKKCLYVVTAIWEEATQGQNSADFKEDLRKALEYIRSTPSFVNKVRISNKLVNAIYYNMKNFSYYIPNGEREQPMDELIKKGKVAWYVNSFDNLSEQDIQCARLLCEVAYKAFYNYEKSGTSLKRIEELEHAFVNYQNNNGMAFSRENTTRYSKITDNFANPVIAVDVNTNAVNSSDTMCDKRVLSKSDAKNIVLAMQNKNSTDLIIDGCYNEIAAGAFENCEFITSVKVPESIIRIRACRLYCIM